jgi:hypothetical protein
MSAVVQDPLAAGREAFSGQQWERAYELLSAADAARTLLPEDLERMSDAACWTRRYEEMLELLERAEVGFERNGDQRGAARAALKLTQEHYQRNHDAVMGAWLARATKLLEGEPDCHENGLLLWMQVRGLLFVANDAVHALDEARELVQLARRLEDPDLAGPAYTRRRRRCAEGTSSAEASTWQPAWRPQPLLGRFSPAQRRSRPRAMATVHLSPIDLTLRDSPRR